MEVLGLTQYNRRRKCKCPEGAQKCPTVIHRISNFSGTEIISPIDISKASDIAVKEQGAELLIGEDYIIQGNKIIFLQEIEELNIIITYYDVCDKTNINPSTLDGYESIEAAKAAGLTVGQMFYLTLNNVGSMYRQTVVYIAE